MAHAVLHRMNFMVERAKINRLRRRLGARSNSEALRIIIDRELAIDGIQEALENLRARGTLQDVFGRVRPKHR